MLTECLSFKTLVTYNIYFLTLCWTTMSFTKHFSLDITQFFVGHIQMSGAHI